MNNNNYLCLYIYIYHSVPGPVHLLSATPLLTAIQITWLTPRVQNGVIITYEVMYEGPQESESVNTTELSFALTDLEPNSSYVFTVSGYTRAGRGDNVTVNSTPIDHSKLPCMQQYLNIRESSIPHACSLYPIIHLCSVLHIGQSRGYTIGVNGLHIRRRSIPHACSVLHIGQPRGYTIGGVNGF